jgi:hypothetical protein
MTLRVQVFIVALASSDRAQHLEGALRDLGLSWQTISAVDGRQMSATHLSRVGDARAGRHLYGQDLSPTEIGCCLSHREAYRHFLQGSASWALILEDDAYPTESVVDFVRWLSSWRATNPMIIECFSSGRINDAAERYTVAPQVEIQRLVTYPGFTVAYAMNQQAAQLALSYPDFVSTRADWPPWAVYVGFWRAIPNLFHHGRPGGNALSTMVPVGPPEGRMAKARRWAALLTGATYLRLRPVYPHGFGQYFKHAVLPSVLYWQRRIVRNVWRKPTGGP